MLGENHAARQRGVGGDQGPPETTAETGGVGPEAIMGTPQAEGQAPEREAETGPNGTVDELATFRESELLAGSVDSPPEVSEGGPVASLEPQAAPTRRGGTNLRPLLIEILQTVLLTLIIFVAVRAVVQNFKVDGASMEPTLHSGQYLLINKLAYLHLDGPVLQVAERIGLAPTGSSSLFPFGGPQRGDIIVFRYPGRPDRDFIKRVIALPGDTVQIEHGRVYVNDVQLHEDYIRALPSYSFPRQKVPEGNYFVLGDNRPNSSDSHIWGFVPEANLIGKAWLSYWPPSHWGLVANSGMAGN